MRNRAPAMPRGGLSYFLCTALSVVGLGLFALPVPAQESPLTGTPAQGTNPDSPSSPPDLVTIAAQAVRFRRAPPSRLRTQTAPMPYSSTANKASR
jgi:hypothetical protein